MMRSRLGRARKSFVQPFYLGLGSLPDDPERLRRFRAACRRLDPATAELLLTEREWRGRTTVSWMIGVNNWPQFVPQMANQLIASELVYAGQGYCVGLALIGTEEAQNGLVDYLNKWLPEHDSPYDQHWAMGALIEIDRVRGTSAAAPFLDGPWPSWIAAQTGWVTDSWVDVGEIVAKLRSIENDG